MVECLTRDRGAAGSSLIGVTALWSLPSLVLVQPKKTRPCLTEILLMGHKESNQTNKRTLGMNGLCPVMRKQILFCIMVTAKGPRDQPAHLCSLISAFVCSLDSILCTISLAISYVLRLFVLIFVQYRTISIAMTRIAS